jgi:membrane protease YdiL (CAAX protease family)
MNKKTFLIGLLSGVIILVVGLIMNWILNLIFPSLVADYQNLSVFRSWSDPLMALYFVYSFLVGIIFVWMWPKTKQFFGTDKECKRGARFGFTYWAITLPGLVMSYGTFPVSFAMVLSWTISGLLQAIAGGIVCAKMLK